MSTESSAATDVVLTLASHTNAGKTTLARTLLTRDIGEVRDAPHVTEVAETHTLITTDCGDRLLLCDTPGFGDSLRLARRLTQSGNPIGWLLREVWDRYRNRPLWCSQQAVQAVRDSADVVLYVVNAAEDPRDAVYLTPELQILGWIGKPVLILLNQSGPPRPAVEERADEARWRAVAGAHSIVQDILGLDAMTRCWVQEDALFARVTKILPQAKQPGYEGLRRAWRLRALSRCNTALRLLSLQIMNTARDRESIPEPPQGRASLLLRTLGLGRTSVAVGDVAMKALAERADERTRDSTDALIRLHGLAGSAGKIVLERLRNHYDWRAPLDTGKAAAFGGVVSGALSGLVTDLASGGLSLGAGLLAGALVGALGGAGWARGHNLVRGLDARSVGWKPEFLDGLTRAAMLRYLAVAHFGRGRGTFAESESPAFWMDEVNAVMAEHQKQFSGFWETADAAQDADYACEQLHQLLVQFAVDLLNRIYPENPLHADEILKAPNP